MALRLLELSWTEAEGIFTLAVSSTVPLLQFERGEIADLIERHGFKPLSADRWTAPADDPKAPLKMWGALSATGYSLTMDMRTLPPSLEGVA
ncbi:hypothetical protein G8E10_24900 [Rhizobiaceae bacterium CRRU44]|uniref:Uncharacterized protein n=1 Tax=Ferranicluibacter rubi TaxID=2715133 RepID=A0AA43ZJE5_9HYPH|nr:hypothetical protein [Ferranicluibacter rubi]NHT78942.1 hypothetical protein [Ferranicluibacter rubi]